jgi:hypothetical protein
LAFRTGWWFSQPTVAGGWFNFRPTHLSSSFAALQGLTRTTLADASRHRLLPWALVPFGTCAVRGPVHAGFACPPPSVRRVWLPSRRLAPSRGLPALFRAGNAYGIHPSERSPRRRSRWHYCRRMTRLPLPSRLRLHGLKVHGGCEPCKPGYRVLPSASPSRCERVFSPSDRRRLPWVSPLSGSSPTRLGRHFGPPPLTRLAVIPVTRDDGTCAAEFRSTSG